MVAGRVDQMVLEVVCFQRNLDGGDAGSGSGRQGSVLDENAEFEEYAERDGCFGAFEHFAAAALCFQDSEVVGMGSPVSVG